MVRASYSRTWQPHLSTQPRELESTATKSALQYLLPDTCRGVEKEQEKAEEEH
jgi:hypothetical protein